MTLGGELQGHPRIKLYMGTLSWNIILLTVCLTSLVVGVQNTGLAVHLWDFNSPCPSGPMQLVIRQTALNWSTQ